MKLICLLARERVVEASVGKLNGAPHRSEIPRPILKRLPVAFEKVNKVNAVFLQEQYSIYQLRRMSTICKRTIVG